MEQLWYGGSRLSWLLLPLAWVYGLAVRLRRLAYRHGLLRAVRLPVPVIIIGNITVGGTGKTPVVEWLVRQLKAAGHRPGIVSRGYGGALRGEPVLVTAGSSTEEVGDEPVLLAKRTGVPVCAGADRVSAARQLVERGAGIVVADDGLQHYALQRDLEIAVVDGARGLGNGWLLPAGPLREPAGRLREVDFVLVNNSPGSSPQPGFTLAGNVAINLVSGEHRPLGVFSGQRVWAVAGIGNPQRFYAALRAAGLEPVAVPVADHGTVDLTALNRLQQQPILMTEKDAVKYRCDHANAWYLPVQASISDDTAALIMARVRSLLNGTTSAGTAGGRIG
jgi:tetraacyldisaccharide 4'-kinase